MKSIIVYIAVGFIFATMGLNWWQTIAGIFVVIIAEHICND